jgi:hypothetical protein
LSSQKCICDLLLIEKDLKRKKNFFIAMSPTQKCESVGFKATWDNAFEPTYFPFRRVCMTPSLVSSLKNHLPRRAEFLTWRSWTPNPPDPCVYKPHSNFSRYFFFSLSPCQKKSWLILIELV